MTRIYCGKGHAALEPPKWGVIYCPECGTMWSVGDPELKHKRSARGIKAWQETLRRAAAPQPGDEVDYEPRGNA